MSAWRASVVTQGMTNGKHTADELAAGRLSLDQLIALNDEMACLVRAGVPLEQGLVEFGREISGRLGSVAQWLGQRIGAGESLERILDSDAMIFSPIWRAVVKAGLRSGKLAAALEGLSTTARRVAELRQSVRVGLVYPLVVVSVAFAAFVLSVTLLAPALASAAEDLTTTAVDPALKVMVRMGETALWWGIAVPAVAGTLLVLALRRPGIMLRAARTRAAWRLPFPSPAQVLRDGRMATFAELLGLLVRQQVPLDESLVLAAAASGDGDLRRAAEAMAERLQRGETLMPEDSRRLGCPPLLAWLILSGCGSNHLAEQLSRTAEQYRLRAARSAAYSRIGFPLLATVVLGGMMTVAQGLVVFIPISRLLYSLGTF
jgi:type II secretory pathway component PulF